MKILMPTPRKDSGGSLLRWRCGCAALRLPGEILEIEPCEEHVKLLSLVTPRADEDTAASGGGVMYAYRKDALAKTPIARVHDSKVARER